MQSDHAAGSSQDESSSNEMNRLFFVFVTLFLLAGLSSIALYMLRRKRRNAKQASALPTYRPVSHHRSASISNFNTGRRNESVFVYDEKMNLIHNSSSPPSGVVPEIHITFPDEEGKSGDNQQGRVVVVHITDSGSIGMEPLHHDTLPPYQKEDADRFQSLDLERIGGLREKENSERRWS